MTSEQASRLYGVLQSTIFCAFAAAVLLDRTSPLFPCPAAMRWAGAGLALAGIALIFAAMRTIGRSIQIAPAPKATATLTTQGVYGRFRHPIYTGIVAVVVGLFLRQPTALVAAASALVIAFLIVKARFEERLLIARYAEYANYRTRTWGLLPFIRS